MDDDLEVDCAPFVEGDTMTLNDNMTIEGQAEAFIGCKARFEAWSANDARGHQRVDLRLQSSSNPLFGDFAPHNYNVFSIVDPFEYRDTGGNVKYLDSATADYYVVG